jgi:antitoxin (DNA-binding transcriptional repressor) of toxin-antitoxin stability system
MTVELQESTKASELVALASSGEEVVLTRDGRVLGKFTATAEKPRVTAEQARKRLGFLKGKFKTPDDIKTPFKDQIEEMFYGNPDKFKR